jgi:hypothetical protein
MYDNELITMVRESVTEVDTATPVAQILTRGRAVRARRRVPGVAVTLVMAAGTAPTGTVLAGTTLLASGDSGRPLGSTHVGILAPGRPGSHPASVRLAAWTVAIGRTATSMSPSTSCRTRKACRARCAQTDPRPYPSVPAWPSSTSRETESPRRAQTRHSTVLAPARARSSPNRLRVALWLSAWSMPASSAPDNQLGQVVAHAVRSR